MCQHCVELYYVKALRERFVCITVPTYACMVTLTWIFVYLLINSTLKINSNVVKLKNLKIRHIQKEENLLS